MKFDPPQTSRRDHESAGGTASLSADAAPEQFAIDLNTGGDRSAPATTGNRWLAVAIGLAVLIHLAIDLVLVVFRPWEFLEASEYSERPLLFALAVPFAQTSLAGLSVAWLRLPLYGRFLVGVIGGCGAAFVMMSVTHNRSMAGNVSASVAAGLATQVAVIVAVVAARSLPRHVFAALSVNADESSRRRLQFGVGSLLIWITLVAVLLGLGQVVAAQLDWHHSVTEWEYFYFWPVLGVCNAVYALLVACSLLRRGRTIVRVVLIVVLIAALSYFQPLVFALLFGDTGGIDHVATLILACTQVAVLYATLLPIRAMGRA